jgi:ABC-type amino acid transport substrate-binding protein
MKSYLLCSLLLLAVLPSSHATQSKIVWGTDSWEGFTNRDGTGFYHELMKAVFPPSEYKMDVHYLPWKRNITNLELSRVDMTGALPKRQDFHYSNSPVLFQTIYLVSSKNRSLNEEDLHGKLGAYRDGYENDIFYAALPKQIKGVGVDDVKKGIELLIHGKIDFFIDIESVIKPAQEQLGVELNYTPIGSYPLHWAFAKGTKGELLKQKFDRRWAELDKSGELTRLYGQYNVQKPF